jgi:HEAT repeat protein
MGTYPELDTLNLEELIARFNAHHKDKFIYYDVVAVRIRGQGKLGNLFLLKALKTISNDDEVRLHALLVALSFRPSRGGIESFSRHYKKWFIDRLRFYLYDRRPHILSVSIEGLCRLKVKSEIDRILFLKDHRFVFVRESVVRYVANLYPERALPILIEAFKDEHPFVQSEAADHLGLLSKAEAFPHLQLLLNDMLLNDPGSSVHESAANAIRNIEFDLGLDRD